MNVINKHNIIGVVGWLVLAILLGCFVEFIMIKREEHQSIKYHFDIEFDDIKRYTIAIIIGSIIHYSILIWIS